ncbi:hypothetical protein SACS_1792 [Parasaccharibacter apium]|uniref:Uncharacterized protein n=1 Tax=Parasaccharibacter apium TaxID=1510841 RepID=A0A7U7G3U2_9PROT|nr:hypothetical protein SACS_1792 [Parasaccharibacter apium]
MVTKSHITATPDVGQILVIGGLADVQLCPLVDINKGGVGNGTLASEGKGTVVDGRGAGVAVVACQCLGARSRFDNGSLVVASIPYDGGKSVVLVEGTDCQCLVAQRHVAIAGQGADGHTIGRFRDINRGPIAVVLDCGLVCCCIVRKEHMPGIADGGLRGRAVVPEGDAGVVRVRDVGRVGNAPVVEIQGAVVIDDDVAVAHGGRFVLPAIHVDDGPCRDVQVATFGCAVRGAKWGFVIGIDNDIGPTNTPVALDVRPAQIGVVGIEVEHRHSAALGAASILQGRAEPGIVRGAPDGYVGPPGTNDGAIVVVSMTIEVNGGAVISQNSIAVGVGGEVLADPQRPPADAQSAVLGAQAGIGGDFQHTIGDDGSAIVAVVAVQNERTRIRLYEGRRVAGIILDGCLDDGKVGVTIA